MISFSCSSNLIAILKIKARTDVTLKLAKVNITPNFSIFSLIILSMHSHLKTKKGSKGIRWQDEVIG